MIRSFNALLGDCSDIIESDGMSIEKKCIQHSNITTYEHSVSVARKSIGIARHFHIKADERSLIRGALLHDYFLYDWHTENEGHNLHGFSHAASALKNASRDFKLNRIERDIIKKHMFPLNIVPPKYKESWIVCLADKLCTVSEISRRQSTRGFFPKKA